MCGDDVARRSNITWNLEKKTVNNTSGKFPPEN